METTTPTPLHRLPAHSHTAPQAFTILGCLLLFWSQISQATRQVHYSWSGEGLWLQIHQPAPAREPGSQRQGCFVGLRRGDPSRPPQETLRSPRPWGRDSFHLFVAFPPHPTALGSRPRLGRTSHLPGRAARDTAGAEEDAGGKAPVCPPAAGPGRLSAAKARGYRQARTGHGSFTTPGTPGTRRPLGPAKGEGEPPPSILPPTTPPGPGAHDRTAAPPGGPAADRGPGGEPGRRRRYLLMSPT